MREINASIPVDKRLWRQDLAGSRAHARMLADCGIISAPDAEAILSGLDQIEAEEPATAALVAQWREHARRFQFEAIGRQP